MNTIPHEHPRTTLLQQATRQEARGFIRFWFKEHVTTYEDLTGLFSPFTIREILPDDKTLNDELDTTTRKRIEPVLEQIAMRYYERRIRSRLTVGAFEIAMHDSLSVRRGETLSHLTHDRKSLLWAQATLAFDPRGERFAVEKLHREKESLGPARVLHGRVVAVFEPPADVWMSDLAREVDFPFEAVDAALGAVHFGTNRLERHSFGELDVLHLVYLTHAARGDEA